MAAERFRRIVDLQTQLHRAAEWRLQDLRRQEQELRFAEQEVLGALNRDDPLYSRLAPTLARRLTRLAAEAEMTSAAGDRQADVVIEQTRQLEQAERRRKATENVRQRAVEKAALGDVIDLIFSGSRATVR